MKFKIQKLYEVEVHDWADWGRKRLRVGHRAYTISVPLNRGEKFLETKAIEMAAADGMANPTMLGWRLLNYAQLMGPQRLKKMTADRLRRLMKPVAC